MGTVTIKGSQNKTTGTSASNTYVSLECTGDFKEASLEAEITLNQNTFVLASDGVSPVTAGFMVNIADWNDLLVSLNFPTFEIKGVDGFRFTLENASLDLSDMRNPTVFAPDGKYMSEYFHLPDPTLWRGVYVDKFRLTFPEWFKVSGSSEPLSIEARKFLVDENGVTGQFSAENIISLEQGSAGGWGFSVNTFQLSMVANNISAFGFAGQIDIPLSEKVQVLPYEACIAKDGYAIKVSVADSLEFAMFGKSKLRIDPTSYVLLELVNKEFIPEAVMNGKMSLNTGGLKMEELVFKKLTVSPKDISVESIGYGGEIKVHNFPVSVSDIHFSLVNNLAALDFRMKLNLMENKIAAGGGLSVRSMRVGRRWDFQGVTINSLKLDSIQLPGFSLAGEIRMSSDHPVYGEYFGGNIKLSIDALDGLGVDVTAIFGTTTYRYWYVNGELNLGSTAIPIGPVRITGFTGGAYYRMHPTGGSGLDAYTPDDGISLGFRAGIRLGLVTEAAFSVNALYEMNFNSHGGINTIMFYGQAEMMSELGGAIDKLARIKTIYDNAQKRFGGSVQSLGSQVKALSDSETAKAILATDSTKQNLSGIITAYVRMKYDFPIRTFDANFGLNISVPGNFIRGASKTGEALWGNLHFSPSSWFIRIGTPSNPVGLEIGIEGLASIYSQSYFMVGDDIEPPAPLPPLVLNMLDVEAQPYGDLVSIGKGIGMGARFGFDTGDMTFLILYARFQAVMGFDFTLTNTTGLVCETTKQTPGMNGWYATGRCYAALDGDLGVSINLFFIRKKVSVIHGGVATTLSAKLPNPTWIGGAMGVDLNILGIIKAKMSMKFSFGEDCKLVRADGTAPPLEFSLISDTNPADGAKDVDVFTSPQITFAQGINKTFVIPDEDNNKVTYRIVMGEYHLKDLNTNMDLSIKKASWNSGKTALTLLTHDVFPSQTPIELSVSVYLEERKNDSWVRASNGVESKTVRFTSGTQPDHINIDNVETSYPLIGQRNFYKAEGGSTVAGYVQLIKGQPLLFPAQFDLKVKFTPKSGGSARTAPFTYNTASSRLEYTMPSLNTGTEYTIDFGLYGKADASANAVQTTTSTQVYDAGDGESFEVQYIRNVAQKILSSGSKSVLDYGFRSSKYTTFASKINALSLRGDIDNAYGMTDVKRLRLLSEKAEGEPFDMFELKGNKYTNGQPLVTIEAIMDDKYYKEDIAPLIYEPLPNHSFKRYGLGGLNHYGRIPTKAFVQYEGYAEDVENGLTQSPRYKFLPLVHILQRVYYSDFLELKALLWDEGDLWPYRNGAFKELNEMPRFPSYRIGKYKAKLQYRLPNGNNGSSVIVKYEYK
jgi:hypothetical protein